MKYTIKETARIHSGVLVLSTEQAKPRLHNLKPLGGKRYEIISPVEFKRGEEISYEGDLPKNLAVFMEDEADIKKREKAEKKAAKEQAEAEQAAAEKAAAEAAAARTALEAEARAAWKENADLRHEWHGDLEAFLVAALQAG